MELVNEFSESLDRAGMSDHDKQVTFTAFILGIGAGVRALHDASSDGKEAVQQTLDEMDSVILCTHAKMEHDIDNETVGDS